MRDGYICRHRVDESRSNDLYYLMGRERMKKILVLVAMLGLDADPTKAEALLERYNDELRKRQHKEQQQ